MSLRDKSAAGSPTIFFLALCLICLYPSGGGSQRLFEQDKEIHLLPGNFSEQGEVSVGRKDMTLYWSEEFDGIVLDQEKWMHRATGERGDGYLRTSQVMLNGLGQLVIRGEVEGGAKFGGMIGTQESMLFRFGYFEARVKLSNSTNFRSAFWLQSPKVSELINVEDSGVEIDIFEYYYSRNNLGLNHALHWGGYRENHSCINKRGGVKAEVDVWYTFGLCWSESGYIFYVNNEEVWDVALPVSKASQFIILSLEPMKGGGPELNDELVVDYVRVYR